MQWIDKSDFISEFKISNDLTVSVRKWDLGWDMAVNDSRVRNSDTKEEIYFASREEAKKELHYCIPGIIAKCVDGFKGRVNILCDALDDFLRLRDRDGHRL